MGSMRWGRVVKMGLKELDKAHKYAINNIKRNSVKLPDELDVFKAGIKPAILAGMENGSLKKLDLNKYYITEYRGGIIASHKKLCSITDTDRVALGIALGYFPDACKKLFGEHKEYNNSSAEIIRFGGISFNTGGLFNESFKWCMEKYADKMIKEYGVILCQHRVGEKTPAGFRIKLLGLMEIKKVGGEYIINEL